MAVIRNNKKFFLMTDLGLTSFLCHYFLLIVPFLTASRQWLSQLHASNVKWHSHPAVMMNPHVAGWE